jgi:16S rRNA G1207 methylase RsmC
MEGLSADDPGIRMLAAHHDAPAIETLLVCCGDVPGVGDAATRVCIDVREAEAARHDCVFERSPLSPDPLGQRRYERALAWPRPHLGKDFTHLTFARAGLHLRVGGRLRVASRTKKGAKSLAKDAERLFGNVRVIDRGGGWRLFESVRTEAFDHELANAWVGARYEIVDPRLGPDPLTSAPGVFSRRGLDRGTAVLIEAAPHLLPAAGEPARILDLGAGIGPLTLWCARRWTSSQIVSVEPNTVAASLLGHNVERAGAADRVEIQRASDLPAAGHPLHGTVDLVISNPPTHASKPAVARMLAPLSGLLSERGRALFVVSRPQSWVATLEGLGAECAVAEVDAYSVVLARF